MANITKAPVAPVRKSFETTRPKAAIKGWFWVGVLFLGIEAVALVGWFVSGDATRIHPGPTPIPAWMQVVLGTWQVAGVPLAVFAFYLVVIRPWRQGQGLRPAGLFMISMLTIFWQDSILNYLVTFSTYNAYFFNLGAWNSHIIGWVSPNGHRMAEPLFFILPAYVYIVAPWVLIGTWTMRQAKARWPNLGMFGLLMIAFSWTALADCIVEPLFMRLGVWAYPGAIRWLSVNPGKYYQFPIYEALLWGACLAAWSGLIYWIDDKGCSFPERGADTLRYGAKKLTFVRVVAFIGAVNAIFLVVYNLPIQFFTVHADAWPHDIVKRSYLTDGFCGPGTTFACSDPRNPFPRAGSARVGPDGEFVPAGTPRCSTTIPASATDPAQVPLAGPAPDCPPISEPLVPGKADRS